jgi:hypothetical protein
MEIDAIATILMGISNTLELIKDQPELRRVTASRYYSTSNDLVFADIQLALNEVLEGILNVQNIELEQSEIDNELAEQIAKSQLNQRLIKE